MKKLLYLLLLLPLGFLGACSSDDDLPDCDIEFTFYGLYNSQSTGKAYLVQNSKAGVTSVEAKSLTDKPAIVQRVSYGWNNLDFQPVMTPPFAVNFETSSFKVGNNLLSISMMILQEGKTVGYGSYQMVIEVVPDEESLPTDAVPLNTVTTSISPEK